MFCPKCSNPIPAGGTQFCSKCGFTTKNITEFLNQNGKIEIESKRPKGIKQGLKLVVLSLILLPAFLLLLPMFPPNDVLVESSPSNTWFEQIGWAVLWTLFLSGLARILFAVFFESKPVDDKNEIAIAKQINESKIKQSLPPIGDIPVSNFGKWKTTDELFEPVLVREKSSGELR